MSTKVSRKSPQSLLKAGDIMSELDKRFSEEQAKPAKRVKSPHKASKVDSTKSHSTSLLDARRVRTPSPNPSLTEIKSSPKVR